MYYDERWIKCSDCLPKEEDYYLTVVVDNGNSHSMQVQRFYQKPRILKGMYGDVETHWELTQWDDYFVTHWMPLPKYPNKDSRSEEHTSELQSHSEISYAVFCLKKKTHY